MASPRIKLDPETVDAIARRMVELLDQRGLRKRELVDAAELARRLGIERSWVYSHAIELGAVKLGNGVKAATALRPGSGGAVSAEGQRGTGCPARPLG